MNEKAVLFKWRFHSAAFYPDSLEGEIANKQKRKKGSRAATSRSWHSFSATFVAFTCHFVSLRRFAPTFDDVDQRNGNFYLGTDDQIPGNSTSFSSLRTEFNHVIRKLDKN